MKHKSMHWAFVDEQHFSKAEVLRLTGLERGAFDGYVQRGVLSLQYGQGRGGSRDRRTYTARDILKATAITLLARCGVAPGNVIWTVEKNGPLDLTLNGFQFEFTKACGDHKSPMIFGDWRGDPTVGAFTRVDRMQNVAGAMRTAEVYAYVVFDDRGLILDVIPKLEKYLAERKQQ